MRESTFLEADEVAALTDRKRCDAQVRALRFMGIEHKVRADGTVAILRSYVNHTFGDHSFAKKITRHAEPDWSAI